MLSPRRPVRVGCGRLRPCEKSNMFDISPDPNRLFFPAINKMSSPRLPQASSDQIYTVLCCPRPPATLSRRPLVPDPLYLSPRLPATLSPIAKQKSAISVWGRLGTPQDTLWGRDLILGQSGLSPRRPEASWDPVGLSTTGSWFKPTRKMA